MSKKKWVLAVAGVAVLVVGTAVLFPTVIGNQRPPLDQCRRHLALLVRAALAYAKDHKDKLPPRDTWREDLKPYLPYPEMKCTELRKWESHFKNAYGYAFNSKLAGRNPATIKKPDQTPIFYDSINLSASASDPYNSVPVEGRHDGMNNVVFLDGTVRSTSAKVVPNGP